MIEPTPSDIGRRVIYQPKHQGLLEYGEITSYNFSYVFVKFNYTQQGVACERSDLEFDKEAVHHTVPLEQLKQELMNKSPEFRHLYNEEKAKEDDR